MKPGQITPTIYAASMCGIALISILAQVSVTAADEGSLRFVPSSRPAVRQQQRPAPRQPLEVAQPQSGSATMQFRTAPAKPEPPQPERETDADQPKRGDATMKFRAVERRQVAAQPLRAEAIPSTFDAASPAPARQVSYETSNVSPNILPFVVSKAAPLRSAYGPPQRITVSKDNSLSRFAKLYELPEARRESSGQPIPRPVAQISAQRGRAGLRVRQVAQPGLNQGDPFVDDPGQDVEPFEVLGPIGELTVTLRRNKILRSRNDVYRVAVVDDRICDVAQFTPREVSIIGRGQGATHVTFWFTGGDHLPITYLVRVTPDPEVQVERERQYQILEEILNELFPDSKVRLLPVSDKLIVRGQAKDSEEAAQIMAVVRGESIYGGDGQGGRFGTLVNGRAAGPLTGEETNNDLPTTNVINMLRIPGVQQVALKVKIAELNRTAARGAGINADVNVGFSDGNVLLQTLLNMTTTTAIMANFDDTSIDLGLNYLRSRGVARILSEPTLVTMSGKPASFVAGGEFAVPTAVGVGGVSAIATDFRSFGVVLNFLPTVVDKDRIRMEISPEFSQVDQSLTVNDTPGLSTRAVTTTVEMREGQSLAIAGLLEDTLKTGAANDFPLFPRLLGHRDASRNETELIILVTPELVQPMDPEEVPPLPGFDVTDPTDHEFYWGGRIEGIPTHDHRSTVWPYLRRRYRSGGEAMISGPFGHGQ